MRRISGSSSTTRMRIVSSILDASFARPLYHSSPEKRAELRIFKTFLCACPEMCPEWPKMRVTKGEKHDIL